MDTKKIDLKSNQRFINRELSWLSFNERVLNEAKNSDYPLLERLRFLSISGNNLDEFHMVRVAGISRQISGNLKIESADGRTPKQQFEDVTNSLKSLLYKQQIMWTDLKKSMLANNIEILSSHGDLLAYKKQINNVFDTKIFPILTPLAIDPAHPFPFLPNLSSSLVLLFKNSKKTFFTALVSLPPKLQRFFSLIKNKNIFVKTEDIILQNIEKLFPKFELLESAFIRVIRDSDIEFEEEAEDLMVSFEVALRKRRLGSVIGLYVKESSGKQVLNFVKKKLKINENNVFRVKSIIDIESISQIIDYTKSDKVFKEFVPSFPQRILDYNGDCFAAIKDKEMIIHHPFESFDVVVKFINQAANDPQVVSIKQTLYRTSANSPIVKALIEAANNGKSVTAVIELKARFDEEKNIRWAKDLEKSGVQIVYGFVNWKTHAKISLVSRKEGKNIQSYVHFGTGNYHPITAKLYTDLSYFSSNKTLCEDAGKIFNFITGYAKPNTMKLISFSPLRMREKLKYLIRKEIENKRKKLPAAIWIKVNSLIDPEIIDEFYKASIAGVKIDLIVRGICGLRPGIPGLSENIKIRSIIGRFLEHSRIYCFANGGTIPTKNTKVFISSADLMTRNLDRRVETFIPIIDYTLHQKVLNQIMIIYMKDNLLCSELNSDGSYRKTTNKENCFSSHEFFMNNSSVSGMTEKNKDQTLTKK